MTTKPILVVDDDPIIRDVVTALLQLEGYTVVAARNGRDGLDKLADIQPCLILLDMRMPVLNGWEFARELRARELAIPLVVMTTASNAKTWADEVHADGYLPKPFTATHLIHEVQRFVA